jgi:hypothetical protein
MMLGHDNVTCMMELIKAHQAAIWWMVGGSTAAFVATLIIVPWLIVRIPPDYFACRNRLRKLWSERHPAVRCVLLMGKNLLGYVMIVAGIAMLVLPGQGLLTMLLGMILVDLPGKYRFERWIVLRPPVFRSINWLRRRAGKAPLILWE